MNRAIQWYGRCNGAAAAGAKSQRFRTHEPRGTRRPIRATDPMYRPGDMWGRRCLTPRQVREWIESDDFASLLAYERLIQDRLDARWRQESPPSNEP